MNSRDSADMSKGPGENVVAKIIASQETLAEIANGDLSPADAYVTGRLEFRGDLSFAKKLYASAASGRASLDDIPG